MVCDRVRVRVRVSGTASTCLFTPDFYGTTMQWCATITQYSLGTHLPLSISGSPASSDWRDAILRIRVRVRMRVRVTCTVYRTGQTCLWVNEHHSEGWG